MPVQIVRSDFRPDRIIEYAEVQAEGIEGRSAYTVRRILGADDLGNLQSTWSARHMVDAYTWLLHTAVATSPGPAPNVQRRYWPLTGRWPVDTGVLIDGLDLGPYEFVPPTIRGVPTQRIADLRGLRWAGTSVRVTRAVVQSPIQGLIDIPKVDRKVGDQQGPYVTATFNFGDSDDGGYEDVVVTIPSYLDLPRAVSAIAIRFTNADKADAGERGAQTGIATIGGLAADQQINLVTGPRKSAWAQRGEAVTNQIEGSVDDVAPELAVFEETQTWVVRAPIPAGSLIFDGQATYSVQTSAEFARRGYWEVTGTRRFERVTL